MRGNSLRKVAARPQGARALAQLRADITEQYDSLSPRLQQVARYALDHPIELAIETVTTVARDAKVQPSAIVRFAQAFGFEGFSDLQRVFRVEVATGSNSYPERLRAVELRAAPAADPAAPDSLAKFAAAQALSIEHLGQSVDAAALDDAVQLLARARHIYVVAEAQDRAIAQFLAYALPQANRPTHAIAAGGAEAEQVVRLISPRDAMIAVCSAPHAEATARLGRLAVEQGVPLIVLSGGPVNQLAKSATIDFQIKDTTFGGLSSVTALLSFATFLAVNLSSETQTRV